MKKALGIFFILFFAIILLTVIWQLPLVYPAVLFKARSDHKDFQVYSDEMIPNKFIEILDSTSNRLEATGFYSKDKKIRIVLCNGEGLTRFMERISLTPPGAGFHHFSGNIFLFPKHIARFGQENAKANGDHLKLLQYSYQKFGLQDLLVHEILLKLHADTLGTWNFKRMSPPHWKVEGFAEYYTFSKEKKSDPNYDFLNRIQLYLKNKDQLPLFYYKSQLMYEYLAEKESLDFSEIMQENITEENTYKKLLHWFNTSQ